MATYSAQNTSFKIPDKNQLFVDPQEMNQNLPENVFVRSGNTVRNLNLRSLGESILGAGKFSTNEILDAGKNYFEQQTGTKLSSLQRQNLADVNSAFGRGALSGIGGQLNPIDFSGFKSLLGQPVGGGDVSVSLGSEGNPFGATTKIDGQLVNQSPTLTDVLKAPLAQPNFAVPTPNIPSAINRDSLSTAPANSYIPTSSYTSASGIYPTSTLQGLAPTPELTETGKRAQSVIDKLQGLNTSLEGRSAYRTGQESAFGVDSAQRTIQDLNAQLTQLKNESAAIPLQLQQGAAERGVTTPLLGAQQNSRLRTNAIAALGVSSLMAAAQGQLANAQSLADKAVAQKYDPIEEQIASATANLNLILQSPQYSAEQKAQAQAQLEIQKAKEQVVADARSREQDVQKIAVTAAANTQSFVPTGQYQTPSQALQAIQNATSPVVAQQLAAQLFPKQGDKQVLGSATTGYFTYDPITGQTKPIGGGGSGGGVTGNPPVPGVQTLTRDQFRTQLENQRGQSLMPSVVDAEYKKYLGSNQTAESIESGSLYDQVKNRRVDLTALPAEQKKSALEEFARRGELIPRPLSQAEKNAQDDAVSGLDALRQIRDLANSGDLPLVRSYIFGDTAAGRLAGTSQFETLAKEVTDIKTRIRTGAALNDQEITFYASQRPAYGDNDADIKKKLDQLEGFYLGMAGLPVTVISPQGQAFNFDDLFDSKQRLGLREAIKSGWTLSY